MFFDVWSNNLAYVLGLSYGCDNQFNIILPKKDKYIIKKIAKELNYDKPLIIGQKAIINLENQFQEVELLLHNIPIEYMKDYIRGIIDSCADIQLIKNNRINIKFQHSQVNKIYEILLQYINIKGGSIKNNSLKLGTQDSIKIAEYVYSDNPQLFLLRKRNKIIK